MNHELGLGAFISDPAITSSYPRLLEVAEELEMEIRRMIEHRRSTGNLGQDVLSILIQAHDETGVGLTDDELIAHAAVLFGAAHLTTANTLAWTLFLLAQHPEVASQLVEELQNILHGEAPTVHQLEQLPLLDRVIKESMRVLPASAYVQRVSAEPVQVGPFQLPKGTVIVWSQFLTHHLPDLYPEPEVFRPERWLTMRPSPYAFLPFGAGPRMCLGGPLAMFTIKITLPVILQRFGLKVVPGAAINARVISTMLTPISPIPMRILPSSSGFSYSAVEGNIHELVTLQAPVPEALELVGAL
ncbi:MAG: cytochrome P450 [Planctomycetes bacterium]|nr:cytochrome P450 [Planctomycetota bacterium]